MARNEFETEVGKLLEKEYPFVHRIADAAFNRNLGRQVSKKPFDYFGSTEKGTVVVAEAKRVKMSRFPFSKLADHQRRCLEDVWNICGRSILFVNFRVKTPGAICGRAFWIPYGIFMKIEATCIASGRKSMTPDHIPGYCELKRIKGGWAVKEGLRPALI